MVGMDETAQSGEVVLVTERLELRRWRVTDAALQRRLWEERDPRVPAHRRISADGHPTVEELEDRIRREKPNASLGLLVAVRRADGEAIGYCGLNPGTPGLEDEPELAYEFLRAEWGQGYATEAARAVVGWAETLGYAKLQAGVREWNTASQRVLEKLGFVATAQVDRDAEHGDSRVYVKSLAPTPD